MNSSFIRNGSFRLILMKVRGRQEEGKFKCEGKRTSFIYSVIIYGLSNWDSRWLGLMLLLLSLVTQLCPSLCNPMHLAHQAPLSMGFSRQEYWSMLPFPSPGDIPNPRIKPVSPSLAGRFCTTKPPGQPMNQLYFNFKRKGN